MYSHLNALTSFLNLTPSIKAQYEAVIMVSGALDAFCCYDDTIYSVQAIEYLQLPLGWFKKGHIQVLLIVQHYKNQLDLITKLVFL